MKRIIALFVSFILVCACIALTAGAEEGSYTLIPSEENVDNWTKTACQGYNLEIEYVDGAAVFSAESVWPCAEYFYTDEEIVTVSVEDYSLVYDFSVSTGATNINFTFTDGFGSTAVYSIANNSLGNVFYDAGSGDLYAGDYKGAIKLSDFVNSTMFLGGTTFPQNLIVDGNITFSAIQVYSVSGATVTVRELSLVPTSEIPEEPVDESSAVIEESVEESDEASTEESVEASTEESVEASVEESVTESVEESTDTTVNEEEGLGIWLYVIIGAAAVVIVVVIVVIAKKKK
ncbi:MAG: hypothetical protein IKY21_05130 [Clostridia bacterium]|nr:hypothetical protein [Clostridia bacterium]